MDRQDDHVGPFKEQDERQHQNGTKAKGSYFKKKNEIYKHKVRSKSIFWGNNLVIGVQHILYSSMRTHNFLGIPTDLRIRKPMTSTYTNITAHHTPQALSPPTHPLLSSRPTPLGPTLPDDMITPGADKLVYTEGREVSMLSQLEAPCRCRKHSRLLSHLERQYKATYV